MNLSDLNWKTWGLVIVVALGGTFEALKRMPTTTGKGWDLPGMRQPKMRPYASRVSGMQRNPPAFLPAGALRPNAQKIIPPDLTKAQLDGFLAAQNKPGQTDSTDPKAEKKKTDGDEWEHQQIRLVPLNAVFAAFDLAADEFRVIAEFVKVLDF